MKVITIIGPYRDERGAAYVHKNIERAREMAEVLWQAGYATICLHLNSAFMSGICNEKQFLFGCQEFVRRSDGIVLLPGWYKSEGATLEKEVAVKEDLPIFYLAISDCHWRAVLVNHIKEYFEE